MRTPNLSLMSLLSIVFLLSIFGILDPIVSAHTSLHLQPPFDTVTMSYSLLGSTTITFTDGDFSAGWTSISVVTDDPRPGGLGPGTSSGNSTQQTNGGNPDFFMRSTNNIVYGDDIFTGGLNTSAVYTPNLSGAIATIDFSIDLLEDPAQPGTSAWQLLLEQGGTLYYSVPLQGFNNSIWQIFQQNGLTANDFDTNPNVGVPGAIPNNQQPDFTANGAPITFGYVLGNGLAGPGTRTVNNSVDNWSVTINVSNNNNQSLFLPIVLK